MVALVKNLPGPHYIGNRIVVIVVVVVMADAQVPSRLPHRRDRTSGMRTVKRVRGGPGTT
jgi:hypothetical protein